MSRIGKQPIAIPSGVDIKLEGETITVKGPKGTLTRKLSNVVEVKREGNELHVVRPSDARDARAHQGLVRSLVANMVHGVSQGYQRDLEIIGVGYRAEKRKRFVRFDLGYSHPIFIELPESVEANVTQTAVSLMSADKELLGQVAAKMRSLRKPEPYKGKGVKYKEEKILRKAGKAGGKK
ncbi:MAG: 50S ribosomal protein L6 [bacterium]